MLQEYQLLYLDNDIPINRSFYCNNGDIKGRGLEVHVLDNSQAKDCTGLTLRMIIKVPSGEMFEATVANGLVTVLNAATGIYQVLFPNNMGKGRLIAEIQISNAVPEVIVSRKFSIIGDGSLTSDGSISVLPQGGLLWNVLTNEAQRQADFDAVFTNIEPAVALKYAGLETEYAPRLGSVESQLAETKTKADAMASGSPKGVYATLTALQSAKPTGDTGAYLVTADGKWYYWSGTAWTSGGTYQATGVSDGTIRKPKLDTKIQSLLIDGSYIDLDIPSSGYTLGTKISYTGVLTADSGGYIKLGCSPGDKIIFTGRHAQWYPLVCVTDASNKVVATYPPVQPVVSGDVLDTNIVMTLPDNSVNLYFNIINTSYAYPVAKKMNDIDINFTAKKVAKSDLDNRLRALISDVYSPLALTFTSGKFISATGLATTNNEYSYTILDAVKGDSFKISGTSYLAVKPYVLLNPDGTVNSFYPIANGSEVYYQDLIVDIPSNGFKLIINSKDIKVSVVNKATSHSISPHKGKTWVAFGDSLTEENNKASIPYWKLIADELGFTVSKFGLSGTGYKSLYNQGNAFYQRIKNIPPTANLITIFGSGNDSGYAQAYVTAHGGSIGLWNDQWNPAWSDTDYTLFDTQDISYCAVVNHTLDNLIAVNPLMKIGVITPTPWKDGQPNEAFTPIIKRMSDALIEICQRRGIPYLDLYRCSLLRPDDQTFRDLAFYNDTTPGTTPNPTGTHLNNVGHAMIAPMIREFIKTLI